MIRFAADQDVVAVFATFQGNVSSMTAKELRDLMERIESWPQRAQEELADIALEIEAEFKRGAYRANPKELAGIDRGLKAAREGRFATDQDVEAVFARYRRA